MWTHSGKLIADSIGHDERAEELKVSQLSGLGRLNSVLKRWLVLGNLISL